MILSRVIEHVKHQNWTAVFLDFVIVVMGVFIGIQVSNWNEARRDRRDEMRFYHQLHNDIMLAEESGKKTLTSRIEYFDFMRGALDFMFGSDDARSLSAEECTSIWRSAVIDIRVADLVSFNELVASGRVGIIRDDALREELFSLQQAEDMLKTSISNYTQFVTQIDVAFPELMTNDAYYAGGEDGVRSRISCDGDTMKHNRAFLNAFSTNINIYESFANRALRPWGDRLADLHHSVDDALGIVHAREAGQ